MILKRDTFTGCMHVTAAVFVAIIICLMAATSSGADTERLDTFNVVYFDTVPFVSLVDLSEMYRVQIAFDPYRLSMTASRGNSTLTVTADSRTAVLNGASRNIILPARMIRGSMYAPIPTVLPLFSELVPGNLTWDERKRAVNVTGVMTTVRNVTCENYSNGAIIKVALTEPLEYTVDMREGGWLTLTMENGSFDPRTVFGNVASELIAETRSYQDDNRAMLSFRLSDTAGDFSASKSGDGEVLISLRRKRAPGFAEMASPAAEPSSPAIDAVPSLPDDNLQVWRIDTVVIDPGHGGKDPGAVGPKGTREKDIVLDVAIELKKIIEKSGEVNVVLTRDKDVFVPLHRRAQIARENRGKLFISLHANAHRNRSAKGFEVYFLSAAKTEDAEEVARRENKAIELEENLDYYASFLHLANLPKDIRDIQIDMESSVYLRESQDMCRIILEKAINSTNLVNRGVKQAGFVVMSGTQAFMPSILVEIGFISNVEEEKLLKRASYQKKLAESIYDAIIMFKQRHERGLFSGG